MLGFQASPPADDAVDAVPFLSWEEGFLINFPSHAVTSVKMQHRYAVHSSSCWRRSDCFATHPDEQSLGAGCWPVKPRRRWCMFPSKQSPQSGTVSHPSAGPDDSATMRSSAAMVYVFGHSYGIFQRILPTCR